MSRLLGHPIGTASIASVLLLAAIVQVIGAGNRAADNVPPEPTVVLVGDTLADVPLWRMDMRHDRQEVTLHEMAGAACSVVVVLDSECPQCVRAAESWSGGGEEVIGSNALPVFWIAFRQDDRGAADFVSTFALSDAWYHFRERWGGLHIGATRTPLMFLLGPDKDVLEIHWADPKKITGTYDRRCGGGESV